MRKIVVSLLIFLLAVLMAFGAELIPFQQTVRRIYQHRQSAAAAYCGTPQSSAEQVDENGHLTGDGFCSHLPLVLIQTGGQSITQEVEVVVSLSVIDNEGGHNHLDSTPAFSTESQIKIRGNSSSRFDKKQYRLTFVNSATDLTHRAIKVMGMPADAEWVLNGPFLDKTCLRNYLMYNLSGELMDWAPNVRYCELFMDGVYRGLYLMVESVKVSKHRVQVTKVSDKTFATGYLVERERINDTRAPMDNFGTYSKRTLNELGIAYPGATTITAEREEYVRQDIGRFEKALYSLDYDEPGKSYRNFIDVQSFIDYYLLNEFSMNIDGGNLSTYAHKSLRGKLIMGPVWDFNNCFNCYEYYLLPINELYITSKSWYVMLFRDERFTEEVIARYHLLRKGVLSDENILKIIDDTVAFLGPAIERNDTVWGYSYDDGWLDPYELGTSGSSPEREKIPLSYDRNPADYQQAVQQLKDCMLERGRFLDEHIEILRQFSAESAVKEWN
jgi:spore coat protein H